MSSSLSIFLPIIMFLLFFQGSDRSKQYFPKHFSTEEFSWELAYNVFQLKNIVLNSNRCFLFPFAVPLFSQQSSSNLDTSWGHFFCWFEISAAEPYSKCWTNQIYSILIYWFFSAFRTIRKVLLKILVSNFMHCHMPWIHSKGNRFFFW